MASLAVGCQLLPTTKLGHLAGDAFLGSTEAANVADNETSRMTRKSSLLCNRPLEMHASLSSESQI